MTEETAGTPLQERIRLAIKRITDGDAPMRVPVDETDPDIVLGACSMRIQALESEVAALTTQRDKAAAYIVEASSDQIGSGDDPVGFLIASHRHIADRLRTSESELDAAKRALAELQAAIDPYHSRLIWNFSGGCYMSDLERKDLDALNAALAAKSTEQPMNCKEAGPGRGLCDMCAAGHYEKCRYAAKSTEQKAEDGPTLYTPLEPTDFMLRAGRSAMRKRHPKYAELSHPMSQVRMIYKAMITAALADGSVEQEEKSEQA